MARLVPEDPFGGLAAEAQLVPDTPDLDLDDAAGGQPATIEGRELTIAVRRA